MKNFFSSISLLTSNKQKKYVYLLFLGGFFSMLLESFGLGLIGVYVALISDPDIIINKIPQENLREYLTLMTKMELIAFISIVLIAVFIFKNIYSIAYLYFEKKVSRSIIVKNSEKLYQIYLHQPYVYFIKNNPQKLVNNINHVLKLGVNYIFYVILLFRECVLVTILFISFIFVSWKISISIFFLLGMISFLIFFFIKKKLVKLGEIIIKTSQLILKNLNENFRSIKLIKIIKNYKFLTNQLSSNLYVRETNDLKHGIYQKIPRSLLEIFAVILIVVITFILMRAYEDPNYFLPFLATLSLILIRMVPSFSNINFAITNLKFTSTAHKNLVEDLKSNNSNKILNFKINEGDNIILKKNITISFKNIEFFYEINKKVLNDISLEFNTNQIIGFVGKSGSGKTTLVDIFIGLLKPTRGKLYIEEKEVELFLSNNWQKLIGYVPQDVYLNNSSIKENIALGIDMKQIDETKVINSLRKANIFEFVDNLPNGINTIVKDLGVNLSGGQKQRLGIARAFYTNPKILVLDEATSALDEYTETNILENLKLMTPDITIILIAHKYSTIKFCDKVFILENGFIKKSGNTENLLENLKDLK